MRDVQFSWALDIAKTIRQESDLFEATHNGSMDDVTDVWLFGDELRFSFRKHKEVGVLSGSGGVVRGVNKNKLDCNISRASSCIYGLAMCNLWEWFCTLTIDPTKYNRRDLEKFISDLSRWLNNQRRNFQNLKYLLVPELHADGESWHLHGFFMGLPVEALHRFQTGDTMGKYIADKVLQGQAVYDWPAYRKKFGFCDFEPVRNKSAAAKYIRKYITKELGASVTEVGAHLYYCSNGLNRPEKIKTGLMSWTNIKPDFASNGYACVSLPAESEQAKELLKSIKQVY